MNPLYENLIAAFIEKAHIERDALLITETLKVTYPVWNLPVEKTIKRFINGETTKPRDTLTGFMAAYVLDKTHEDVEIANRNNEIGTFFQTFQQHYENELAEQTQKTLKEENLNVRNGLLLVHSQEEVKKLKARVHLFKWVFSVILLLLVLAFVIYLIANQKPNLAGIGLLNMIPVKGSQFSMGDTNNEDLSIFEDSKALHIVTIDSFEMSDTEITFELFELYCNYRNIPLKEDLGWGRNAHPAIMLDWYEAVDFCNWLSEL